jgi:hypothetical protein
MHMRMYMCACPGPIAAVRPAQSFEPGETAGLSVGAKFNDAEETYFAKATIQV